MKFQFAFLLICSLTSGSVNGAYYFFGKLLYGDTGSSVVVVPNEVVEEIVSVPDKKIVVLDESVDDETALFGLELEAENRRAAQIKAIKRAQYIASLPQEHDSMEMISREASLQNRLNAKINRGIERLNRFIAHLSELKYGHDQYSDSESKEEYIVEEPASENEQTGNSNDSSNSSSYSDTHSITTDDMIDSVIGKPQQEPYEPRSDEDEPENKEDDAFEVVDAENDPSE